MYKLTSAFFETIKTFFISIICSVIFSLMIYRDTVLFSALACFILNVTSFILFLFLFYKSWSRVYMRSFTKADYWVPALVSYAIFCGISSYLYIIQAKDVFPWLFQQTRFLEPLLNREYKFISFIIAQLLILGTLGIIPIFNPDRM